MLDGIQAVRSANFHICFLWGLGRLLGIEPDTEGYRQGMVCDMIDGVFRVTAPLHRQWLNADESAAVYALSRMNYTNMHLYRMSRLQRNALLDGELRYFSLHHTPLGAIKSLDVLRVLF